MALAQGPASTSTLVSAFPLVKVGRVISGLSTPIKEGCVDEDTSVSGSARSLLGGGEKAGQLSILFLLISPERKEQGSNGNRRCLALRI